MAHVVFTSRADGDLSVDVDEEQLRARRRAVVDRPWFWLRQVHGNRVVVLDTEGDRPAPGVEADAAVTSRSDTALAIHTADCGPLALLSRDVIGAVHAGWRGLSGGVVEAAVEAMRDQGAVDIEAVLGPCIHVECYEFGSADLEGLRDRFGPSVVGRTIDDRPALDVPAAVREALRSVGIDALRVDDACTACDERYFSHRARGESGRQAMVVWRDVDG